MITYLLKYKTHGLALSQEVRQVSTFSLKAGHVFFLFGGLMKNKLSVISYVDPKILIIDETLQRQQDKKRLKTIQESIKKEGYWGSSVIVANDKRQIIEGQHRVAAAVSLGIKKVPVTFISYANKQEEASRMMAENNHAKKLKPSDFWNIALRKGDTIAKIIYRLEDDKNSLFFNKIAIKGKSNLSTRIGIPMAIDICACISLNTTIYYHSLAHEKIRSQLEKNKYSDIVESTNEFLLFFFEIAGEKKENLSILWKIKVIRAFITIFLLFKRQNISMGNRNLNKLKSINMDGHFLKMGHSDIVRLIITNFNKGKRKGKLQYDSFDAVKTCDAVKTWVRP